MNRARMRALAERLENHAVPVESGAVVEAATPERLPSSRPVGFTLDVWSGNAECGAVGCIAGWAADMAMRDRSFRRPKWQRAVPAVADVACVWLGLDQDRARAYALFVPAGVVGREDSVPPATAAAVLRLVASGTAPGAAWDAVLPDAS